MESSLEYGEFEMPGSIHMQMLSPGLDQPGAEKARGIISTLQCSDSTSEDTSSKHSHNFGLKEVLVLGVDMMDQKEPWGKRSTFLHVYLSVQPWATY